MFMIPHTHHHIHLEPAHEPPQGARGWHHRLWGADDLLRVAEDDPAALQLLTSYLEGGDTEAARLLGRILVLAEYGGVYTDADVHLAEGLRTAPCMQEAAWLVRDPDRPDTVAGCAMGMRSGHPFLASLRRAVERIVRQQGAPRADELGDRLLTEAFSRKKRRDIPLMDLWEVAVPEPPPSPETPQPRSAPEVISPSALIWNLPAEPVKGPSYTRTPPDSIWS